MVEADLGGGVSCRLPLALYADKEGTLPRPDAKLKPSAKPADFPPTGDDRATRLACVCLAWGVLQHFYPYFEETKADWPDGLREALTAAATDPDAAKFHRTLCRLIARLEDSHGSVRPGSGAPRYDGALPLAWDVVEGKLAVTWVDPAAKLRIEVGDVVESIDGTPAADCVKAAERLASGATPGHRRYRTCAGLRIGPAGQSVTLALRTPSGTAYEVKLLRALTDDSPLRGPSMREPRLERFARPAPGVVYLDLDRYRDEDFDKDLAEVQKAEGVIFDVRGYPQIGMYVLRLFAPKPWIQDQYSDVITLRPDRRGVTLETYKPPVTKPVAPPWKAKVAFLTDSRAVSYAETFLAIADNTKIGTIVGEPTAGSNGGIGIGSTHR
ncbi:MAG: S41 family peptidase [Gemmataceae bacterium]